MNKFIKALARHELAHGNVKRLSLLIVEAIRQCPIDIKAMSGEWDDQSLWDKTGMHTLTHLHCAINEPVVHYDYYEGEQHRKPAREEIEEALDADGCSHCLEAWRLILERKVARKELGYARLSIRALGRQALLMVAIDDN